MIELSLEKLHEDLIKVINESGLPLALVDYKLRDIQAEIKQARMQQLKQERAHLEAQQEETPEAE